MCMNEGTTAPTVPQQIPGGAQVGTIASTAGVVQQPATVAAGGGAAIVMAHANKKAEVSKVPEKIRVTIDIIRERLGGLPIDPFGIHGTNKALLVDDYPGSSREGRDIVHI